MDTNIVKDIAEIYFEQVATSQIDEGIRPGNVETPLDKAAFKKRRRSLVGREKSAEARKRGHEGKTWADSGRTYSPDEAKSRRKNMSDTHRSLSYGTAENPDDNEGYPAVKTKNPKKLRKQKAMGELGEENVQELFLTRLSPEEREKKKREKKVAALITLMKHAKDPASDVASTKKEEKEKPARWWDDDGDGVGYEKGEVSGKFKRKKKVEEAAKPNDGNLANNYPPYDKVTRGDVIAGRLGKDQMGGKKKTVKEGFSDWRTDLCEIIDKIEKSEKVVEKKVENKIVINPSIDLGDGVREATENLGGTLIEMVEIDEVDFVVESVYDELLEEGYEEDDIEEALEFALTEAKVTFGHDTPTGEKKRGNLVAAVGRLARQKLSSKVRGAKKAVKQAVATGARKVAKGALGVARKMEGGDKKPAATAARKPSTYRGAGAGTKEKVSSGSYTPPTQKKAEKPADPWGGSATTPAKPKAKTKKAAAPKAKAPAAAAPKRKRKSKLDDLLADIRSEEVQINELSVNKMLAYGKAAEKDRDALNKKWDEKKASHKEKWRVLSHEAGEERVAQRIKKKTGKYPHQMNVLDKVRYSITKEEVHISEKTLTAAEKKKKEEIAQSMDLADFEKRYPGRGMEVKMATATKMAKKIAEQAMELQPKAQPQAQKSSQDARAKAIAQKAKTAAVALKTRELQTLRQTPAGTAVSSFG